MVHPGLSNHSQYIIFPKLPIISEKGNFTFSINLFIPSILKQKKVNCRVTFTIAKIEQPINGSPKIVYNTSI
jgi:hypothetical protein